MRFVRRKQSRLESLLEAAINIATGFLVSFLVWVYVMPIFFPHIDARPQTAFWVTVLFTITSMTRQYVWRRFFENEIHLAIRRLFRDH